MGPKKEKRKSTSADTKMSSRGEVLQIRSPAEFFAENQNIAGFDNPGKSLYTTIRELVENSLDAAESIHELPSIELEIEEMNEEEFGIVRGVQQIQRTDHDLYSSQKKNTTKKKNQDEKVNENSNRRGDLFYYKVRCRDNGVGMDHEKIPHMLGRVLSGSKYGVRQTRGKFGLGAKMALIWSKKSTGMPIEVKSAYSHKKKSMPTHVSYCKLDIDILKNEPNTLIHKKEKNESGWRGTDICVIIGGNWSSYKSRIIQYLQQLAIITPYAEFELSYICRASTKRNFTVRYERRSDQMPPIAKEIKHHPSALNDLLLKTLMQVSKQKSLVSFLEKDLSNIDFKLANRIVQELGEKISDIDYKTLNAKNIHQIVCLLKQVEFKLPDGKFLSPAGEYNLRLGIIKELEPDLVATHTEKIAIFEGHSFLVEAGVSIGGNKVNEGINIFRFANRIPLLFEAGGDVVTRTANKQIKWSNYKIDAKRDKIGVFVSIVSTKIPFKGTGKEYIGDDIPEIKKAVKHVLQQCCLQLRSKLAKSNALKEELQRKKKFFKHIPDVSRAMFGVLTLMKEKDTKRRRLNQSDESWKEAEIGNSLIASVFSTSGQNVPAHADSKFLRAKELVFQSMAKKEISEKTLEDQLHSMVQTIDEEAALDQITQNGRGTSTQQNLFILPLNEEKRKFCNIVQHPAAFMKFYTSVLE